MTETIRVPIICPTCKGTGSLPLPFYGYGTARTLEAAICPRCYGTDEIGYVERTQAEIDEAWRQYAEEQLR